MALVRGFNAFLAQVCIVLAASGLIAMTAIISWQVFGRFVLNDSPSWTEAAALTLMIWFVPLAAAAGVREGFHIRIVALEEAVPVGLARMMRGLAHLVVMACGAAMLVWGGELVARTWSHVIPSLGLPRGVAYLALPIAGALMVLFAIERAFLTPTPALATVAED